MSGAGQAAAPSALVLGAGVAGLSTALYLHRAGWEVTVLDPLGPAGGASFGNAGALSADTSIPIALPGMLRKVPGWLMDPLGPLAVRPSYLPRAAPWLMRWALAGRIERVLAISDAMRSLHEGTFACWREMLGDELYRDIVRQTGQVQIWESAEESPTARLERELRDRQSIPYEVLGPDELRQLLPGLSPAITRGVLMPRNGHVVNPARAVHSLAALLQQEGGTILPERAMKLVPRTDGGGWTVITNTANRAAAAVVVAGGAWSGALLGPLGLRLPLETERGYHAALPVSLPDLRLPVTHKDRGFIVTPMEHEVRIAGTVEIAGLEAAPDERRARILAGHAQRLFPGLAAAEPRAGAAEPRLWMGFRPSLPDSLPVLGPAPGLPGLHLCLGHGHFGMTAGPPSGRLVAALVAGRPAPIDPEPYSALRFR
jgi:D-amino-acid dehydrogenase